MLTAEHELLPTSEDVADVRDSTGEARSTALSGMTAPPSARDDDADAAPALPDHKSDTASAAATPSGSAGGAGGGDDDTTHLESILAAHTPTSATGGDVELDSVALGDARASAGSGNGQPKGAAAGRNGGNSGGHGSGSGSARGRPESAADQAARTRAPWRFRELRDLTGGAVPMGCPNALSAVAFSTVCVVMFAVGIADLEAHEASARESYILVVLCVASALLGLVLLVLWIWATDLVLRTSQLASTACVAALGIYVGAAASWALGGVLLAVSALLALWWRLHAASADGDSQKDFAAVLLRVVSALCRTSPTLGVVLLLVLLAQTLWLSWTAVSAVQALTRVDSRALHVLLSCFLLFGFVWSTQLAKAVVHCVTAGTVAHRYFRLAPLHDINAPVELTRVTVGSGGAGPVTVANSAAALAVRDHGPDVVMGAFGPVGSGTGTQRTADDDDNEGWGSDPGDRVVPWWCLKRACWSSYGSVCFAALCTTPVYVLSGVMLWLARVLGGTHASGCVPERLFHSATAMYAAANEFGFSMLMVHPAGVGATRSRYGVEHPGRLDFVSCSRASADQFLVRGVDDVVGKDHVSQWMAYPAFGSACALALLCALWARHGAGDGVDGKALSWDTMSAVIALVSYAQVALSSQVLEAGVAAVLWCFAEEPQRLAATHPILFHRFVRIAEFSSFHRTAPQL